jgi:hypothetical protein
LVKDELDRWEARLTAHFAELRQKRDGEAESRPIFGLEHGLQAPEIEALSTVVRAAVADRPPPRGHHLAWVVYASEIGYGYSGDEYWQTFEERTPGWSLHGDRYWIRDCFHSFERKYRGAKPSGPWAGNFTIICWPIRHAILPKDLQRQLAQILYELRTSFSAKLLESPATLGEFIAARSWTASSRFQNFAEDTELVGQIAAALLLQGGKGDTGSLIHPPALKRISGDLDRERLSRDWLRGARRFAEERARVSGLGLTSTRLPGLTREVEEARSEINALGIEPRLVIRPTDPERTQWDVSLEIPDLSHLLFRFPNAREILTGSRCVVAGSSGRPLARGRCLHGAQRVTLVRWPRSDEVLIQFEERNPSLEFLLRTECLLRPGPTWLFRISSDGLAYEQRGLRVRAGEHYIVVRTTGPYRPNGLARPIELACEGINAAILKLPSALTDEWEDELRRCGLRQARAIEVWPAGLAAAVWDGEGRGEWLASERPCLAISSDHPIASLAVSLAGVANEEVEVNSLVPGKPVFVELPELPVGLHTVRVRSRRAPTDDLSDIGDLDVMMRIRDIRPWSPGVSPQGPLVVQVEPSTPTLEALWEGRVAVRVGGPTGRRVKCKALLFRKEGESPTLVTPLPPFELPLSPEVWRERFEKHFRETKAAQMAYDSARICRIDFNGEELGAFSLSAAREFVPLRWVVRLAGQTRMVRLIDDSGGSDPPAVSRMAFATPCRQESLPLVTEYPVGADGGMYVARVGEFAAAVIAPPEPRGLSDLRCTPQIAVMERSAYWAVQVLGVARLWGSARVAGDFFSATRKREVLVALASHLSLLVCGQNWAENERAFATGTCGTPSLQREISKRHGEADIGVALGGSYPALATAPLDERVAVLSEVATRHLSLGSKPGNVGNAQWLAELALRVASDPAEVEKWAGIDLRDGIARLLGDLPALARAARFVVLATDRHLESRAGAGELYAGWRWS